MIACDTSVLVAAFARWHDAHLLAATALARTDALVDHVALETFSVLTRLPAPRRAAGPDSSASSSATTTRPAGSGIVGGAVYDLVVALSAAAAQATLLSLDRRAAATYEAARIEVELLS